LAAVGVGSQFGKKGLQNLIDNAVRQAVDKELEAKIAPRLVAVEARISAIESTLDLAQRLAKMEAEVSALKAARA
jgi:phage baseplate assembly protein W